MSEDQVNVLAVHEEGSAQKAGGGGRGGGGEGLPFLDVWSNKYCGRVRTAPGSLLELVISSQDIGAKDREIESSISP